MTTDSISFRRGCGARIRELRMKHKLTQAELAQQVHTSHSNIAKIECGVSNPSFDLLIELRNYFNVSSDYILFGTDIQLLELVSGLNDAIKILSNIIQNANNLNTFE